MNSLFEKSEKKVEYVELIYDLIFVYLVSRNVSVLETTENGFVPMVSFMTYLASSVVVLQIWYVTTLYMNHYGDSSLREHLMLFVNMYLLYYMAEGIRSNWGSVYALYHIAWALILINMAAQFYFMGRYRDPEHAGRKTRYRHALLLAIEAGLVLASIPIYAFTGYALSPWALVFAGVFLFFTRDAEKQEVSDFPHLAERVMLYIVFTFGEMLLSITGYFGEGFSLTALYYSVMAFALVAGLFSAYGHYYNHLMDPEAKTSGTGYMMLHIVMILALSNITAAMEFLRKVWFRDLPKAMFLALSVLLFYVCLFLTQRYARYHVEGKRRFLRGFVLSAAVYVLAMALCCRQTMATIGLTVAFIYLQLLQLHYGGKNAVDGAPAE